MDSRTRGFASGYTLSGSELLHCSMIDAKLPCEFLIRSACLQEEFPHLLPPLIPSLPVGLLNQQFALAPWQRQKALEAGARSSEAAGSCCLREEAVMRCNRAAQRFTEVAQQVPAVRYLHSLRGRPASGFGVDTAAVAADDLCPRMPAKPCSATVLASRSGSRSTTLRVSRSHRIVP